MALQECPECGAEMSDKAESCPECGYSREKEVEQKATACGCLAFLAFAFIFGGWLMLPDCSSDSENESTESNKVSQKETPPTEEEKEKTAEYIAYMGCRRALKQRLKSPSSADFPIAPEHSSCDDQNNCKVEGEFEAKNPMGTMLRKEYVCEIKLDPANPGTKKMELQRLEFK